MTAARLRYWLGTACCGLLLGTLGFNPVVHAQEAAVPPPAVASPALLAALDTPTVVTCSQLVAQLDLWQQQAAVIDPLAAAPVSAAGVRDLEQAVTDLSTAVDAQVGTASAKARKALGLEAALTAIAAWKVRVTAANTKLKAPRLTAAQQTAALTEKRTALVNLAGWYQKQLLPAIAKVQEPTQLARDFLQDRYPTLLSAPQEVNGLRFQLVEPAATVSLFDPAANLSVNLEYAEGVKLEATGLYYLLDGTPQLEKLKLKSDPATVFSRAGLTQLGTVLPPLGLPIKVKKVQFAGFTGTADQPAGAVDMDIELNLRSFLPGLATSVKLYPNADKTVELAPGGLAYRDTAPNGYPLGSTGISFYNLSLALDPDRGGTLTVKADLAVAGTSPDNFKLACSGAGAAKGTDLALQGQLISVGSPIGDVEILCTDRHVGGTLLLPGTQPLPIGEVLSNGKFEIVLGRDSLTGQGNIDLLGIPDAPVDLRLGFDGFGTLTAGRSLVLLGRPVTENLLCKFEPGFRKLALRTNVAAHLNCKLFPVDAAVAIDARAPSDMPVKVTVAALGVPNLELNLASLAELTPQRLEQALNERCPDLAQAVLNAWQRETRGGQAASLALRDHVARTIALAANQAGLDATLPGLQNLPAAGDARPQLNGGLNVALDKLVAELNRHVELERIQNQTHRDERGNRVGQAREVHLRIRDAYWVKSGQADVVVGFTITSSSFAATLDSRKATDQREQTSDVAAGTILLSGLQTSSTPKATIRLPELKETPGSGAKQLAADHVQQLLQLYLPQVTVVGPQKQWEKRIAVRNLSTEPATVWVQARARTVTDGAFAWKWTGEPGTNAARSFTVPAGQTVVLGEGVALPTPSTLNTQRQNLGLGNVPAGAEPAAETGPVHGSRLRLWAESASGELWDHFRRADLWVVEENPKLDGERAYYGDKLAIFTYTIKPNDKPKIFSERLLGFKNSTAEALKLRARYRTVVDGQSVWRDLPEVTLGPGQSYTPKGHDGLGLRASLVYFAAEGTDARFDAYKEKPLYLVEATAGRRLYAAKKILPYVYEFRGAQTVAAPAAPAATPATRPGVRPGTAR